MKRFAPPAILLCVQACLLYCAIDLLPAWADEWHTLGVVSHPVREIIPIVQGDIHPPLYYVLLRAWVQAPLPWGGMAALRAFSAFWALLATVLLDLLWTRNWKPFERWLALSVFALSPCLLLYGRMARSYSMQCALAVLALGLAWQWMRQPRSAALGCAAAGAMLALLYTHYVPGLALLAGFVAVAWRNAGAARAGVFSCAVAAGYLPWILTLGDALRRWGGARGFSSGYALSGNTHLEHLVKAGFGVVSLTIGESFLFVSVALVPVFVLLVIAGARTGRLSREFVALAAVAGLAGYVAVSRWVSYPFIPARLLWLLPVSSLLATLGISRLRRSAVRRGIIAAIVLSYGSSAILYFRRENFLNPGYAAPTPEIAARLNREAQARDLIIVDAYNTDSAALRKLLSGGAPVVVLDEGTAADTRRRLPAAATVWIIRNTRDISPGRLTTAVQSEACAGRAQRDTLLEPYAPWQQSVMKMAGLAPLTHFYQLTACGPAGVNTGGR